MITTLISTFSHFSVVNKLYNSANKLWYSVTALACICDEALRIALPMPVEVHNGRDHFSALRRISHDGILMDPLRKHCLLASAVLLLLTSVAAAHHCMAIHKLICLIKRRHS